MLGPQKGQSHLSKKKSVAFHKDVMYQSVHTIPLGTLLVHDASIWKERNVSQRPPLPPFTTATAIEKVRLAEDAWNARDPQRVALAYTQDSRWRNRSEFINGREEIIAFLTRKWASELDYRLTKELWIHAANRLAVRYAYEFHDDAGTWFRAYGNENWEFDENGLMQKRYSSINNLPIKESERKFHWPLGRRPDDHPGLSELGL